MSKKLIALVAIFAVALTGTVFAAVENIKVSGNYTMYGIARNDFDFGTEIGADNVDSTSGFASVTNLKFDADLTEDVMFTYIIRDERVMGLSGTYNSDDITSSALYTACAFATLKDFLSYPITLKLGMQGFKLGSGLVVADSNTNQTGGATNPFGEGTGLGDLSPRKAFYGSVATVDLDPATLTLAWLKASEGEFDEDDDRNFYIANLGYNFEDYNTMGEVYWVYRDDQKEVAAKDDVTVYGVRAVSTLIDSLTMSGEYAYQKQSDFRADGKDASDYAMQFAANYAFLDVDYAPAIGIDYTLISANWDPMSESWTPARIANAIFPNTNCETIGVNFSAEPREDISVKLRYAYMDLTEKISAFGSSWVSAYSVKADKTELGSEIDFTMTYDYTEDVQFGVWVDYFEPGDFFDTGSDTEAVQAVGTMKVSF